MDELVVSTEHFEVSFVGVDDLTRTALAHSEEQARELITGFCAEGLKNVKAVRITTTREPFNA